MPKTAEQPITRNRATHHDVFVQGWFAGWSMTCEGHNAQSATAVSFDSQAAGEPVSVDEGGPFGDFLRSQAEQAWEQYRATL